MSSIIGSNGVFDNTKMYAVTNITTEDFTTTWDGRPITLRAGVTGSFPQYLADKITDEIVNLIMIGNAKLDEVAYYKANPNTQQNSYRAASSLGVPSARKSWEDQIVHEIAVDEETPEIQTMRIKIREELLSDMKKEASHGPVTAPSGLAEFAELPRDGEMTPPAAPKKEIKVKEVKIVK